MSQSKNKKIPLIIEPHPEEYEGYEFITLIKYYDQDYLCIVDNINKKQIISYVLDYCASSDIDEEIILDVANYWYHNHSTEYPISIEFSKREISHVTRHIVKTFSLDYTTRIIGPIHKFEMQSPKKIQRRKARF